MIEALLRLRSTLVRSSFVALVIAALLTLIFVDTETYRLSKQTSGASLAPPQRLLIVCYSIAFYFVLLLPGVSIAAAGWGLAKGHFRGPAPKPEGRSVWQRVERVLFPVLAVPVAVAAVAFVVEIQRGGIAFDDVESQTDRRLNVILVVIDTLRADHVGSYGYARNTTPFLDSLAAEGVLFSRAYTHVGWTKPSVASILTSLYPGQHGANRFEMVLPHRVETLAELFSQDGFLTYGYVANPNLKTIFNFDQGFAFYDDFSMRDRLYLAATRQLPFVGARLKAIAGREFDEADYEGSGRANARILPWLERYHDQRFFMYLHYMDPHHPYSPPPPYDTMLDERIPGEPKDPETRSNLARYDGEIRFVDHHLEQLSLRLQELGIADETLVVVTSDHGEAFGEHGGWGHGRTIYQDQLHVPLIMRYPPVIPAGTVVDATVRSIDIAPTILAFAGIDVPKAMEGRSLVPGILGGPGATTSEPVFVDHVGARNDFRLKGLIGEDLWKYILTLSVRGREVQPSEAERLFDLGSDPRELDDLSRQETSRLAELRRELEDFGESTRQGTVEPSEAAELDPETEEQLKALGYIE